MILTLNTNKSQQDHDQMERDLTKFSVTSLASLAVADPTGPKSRHKVFAWRLTETPVLRFAYHRPIGFLIVSPLAGSGLRQSLPLRRK